MYLYVELLSRLTVYVAGKVSYSLYYAYLLFIVNARSTLFSNLSFCIDNLTSSPALNLSFGIENGIFNNFLNFDPKRWNLPL